MVLNATIILLNQWQQIIFLFLTLKVNYVILFIYFTLPSCLVIISNYTYALISNYTLT